MFCGLGALYPDGTSGALKEDDGVPPNGVHTYNWTVKPESAPIQGDSNCLTWAYHSHVVASKDISSGLIGALLTCKTGMKVIYYCKLSFYYCKLSHIFIVILYSLENKNRISAMKDYFRSEEPCTKNS